VVSERNSLQSTYYAIKIAVSIAIICVMAGLFIMKERFDDARAYEAQRAETALAINNLADDITARMTRIVLVGTGFSGAIALKPEITQDDFETYVASVLRDDVAVANVALGRDSVIEFVYPYEQNADVVGYDLRERPEQWVVAERARETGENILQGPVELVQGFEGYILREPIFLRQDGVDQYWGLMSIVFSAELFFEGLGIEDVLASYELAIRSPGGEAMVLGEAALFSQDTVQRFVDVPGGLWEVAAIPRGGWIADVDSAGPLILFLLATVLVLLIANALFHQREKALYAGEQLQAAIGVLADGFVLFDRDDRLIVCNQRYREIYAKSAPVIRPGVRFEELLRYGLEQGQYTAAKGREDEWLAERIRAHRSPEYTLEQQLDDGRWLRVREMATPDGGRVGIRVDITEQVNSRKRAEIAETRLRDAIDVVPASFWLFDPQERLELVNGRALASVAEIGNSVEVGKSLEDFVARIVVLEQAAGDVRDGQERARHILRLLRGESAEFELRLGRDSWLKFFSHRTNEGGIVCFSVDVSELMLHERWLQQSNARLRAVLKERDKAEARFADVADISSEWFWEQDADARLTFVSSGFQKATGVPPEAVLGKRRSEWIAEDVGDNDLEHRTIAEKVAAREPFFGYIYRSNLRPDEEAWYRSSGKPVYDEHGAFRGYIGTAGDVTQLYTALRGAQRADEAKTQFLNVISHELRTPMTIVLGFNAFLLNVDSLPEFRRFRDKVASGDTAEIEADYLAAVTQVKRFAEKIQAAGDQLQHLIQDILDLARIEANTMHIDVARVQAAPVVQSIVEQMQPLATEKGVALVAEVAEAALKCDETRLRQILINLVANAIKFTDTGAITIRVAPRDGMIEFCVEDTGIGIPEEALPTIFDRFTQVDISSTRNQGGAGLGLSISKELIRLQGGTITATSVQGEGTTIVFTIPAWETVEATK
jgi:PAS domain S-box-containing protein